MTLWAFCKEKSCLCSFKTEDIIAKSPARSFTCMVGFEEYFGPVSSVNVLTVDSERECVTGILLGLFTANTSLGFCLLRPLRRGRMYSEPRSEIKAAFSRPLQRVKEGR